MDLFGLRISGHVCVPGTDACVQVRTLALIGIGALAVLVLCVPCCAICCCMLKRSPTAGRHSKRRAAKWVEGSRLSLQSFAKGRGGGAMQSRTNAKASPAALQVSNSVEQPQSPHGRLSSVAIALPSRVAPATRRLAPRMQRGASAEELQPITPADDALPPPPPPPLPPSPRAKALPRGWEAVFDDDGKTYYYEAATGRTQWEEPRAVAPRSCNRC